jgi:glycosyltransferase involved in cell wall biosynthesis
MVDLIFITYNRLQYTRLSLQSVLADPVEEFSLTIWDNASTDGTVEYLKSEVCDSRIADIVLCKENVGQVKAVNEIWGRSRADLLGKLDNDCLVTAGWTRTLAKAHADIDRLGVVACWHYPLDDFDERAARRAGKIQSFGGHQILRHPWTCGTGLLIKRGTYQRFGPLQGKATTRYWIDLALAGYVNGFYYPLILQEHMDDPQSPHCLVKDDEGLQKYRETSCVLRDHHIRNMQDRYGWRREVLENLNKGPWDVRHYVGWLGRLRRWSMGFRRMRVGMRVARRRMGCAE